MSEKITYICDIHGCGQEADKYLGEQFQVIFTTDQTEGKTVEPYLSYEDIDLCDDCANHLLQGNYIFCSGGQGQNKYWFKK